MMAWAKAKTAALVLAALVLAGSASGTAVMYAMAARAAGAPVPATTQPAQSAATQAAAAGSPGTQAGSRGNAPSAATPEALARRFVDLVSTGKLDEAQQQLYLTPQEFQTLFDAPDRDAIFRQLQVEIRPSLQAVARQMQGVRITQTDVGFPAPGRVAPEPFTVPAGSRLGPLTLRDDTKGWDNMHVRVRCDDGRELDVKLDEVLQVNGQTKLMEPASVQVLAQPGR